MLHLLAGAHLHGHGHRQLALACSLLAALALGGSAVLQHSAAANHPDLPTGRLVLRLLTTPRWLAGRGFDLVALILHAVALRNGPLVLVQAILASSLLVALGIGAVSGHHRLTATEWLAASGIAGGLVVLVGIGAPHGGATPSFGDWIGISVGSAVATLGVLALLPHLSPTKQAAALGSIAGVLFAVDAAFLKAALAHSPRFGWEAPLHRWETIAFIVSALAGNLLVARAFQRARLTASLPGVTAAEPITAVLIGLAFFSEHLRPGLAFRVVEALALAALVAGVLHLARSPLLLAPDDDGGAAAGGPAPRAPIGTGLGEPDR